MEAASGFEPLDKGFADLSLSHLGTPPIALLRKAFIVIAKRIHTVIAMHNNTITHNGITNLERATGFEPATPTLARLCSTN